MKNNLSKLIIYLFLSLGFFSFLNAEEQFIFKVTEIDISENGNLIVGSKGGKATTNDGFEITGSHDGYSRLHGCPIHVRKFKVKPRYVHITDEILDGAGQAAEGHFVLHPNVSISAMAGNNFTLKCRDTKLLFETSGYVKVSDAVWYPDQGVSIATKKITVYYGPAPVIGEVKIRANDGV